MKETLKTLNKVYDDKVHPAVMTVMNYLGLGDRPRPAHSPDVRWGTLKNRNGSSIDIRLPDPTPRSDFFKTLGKTSVGATGVGALSALLSSWESPMPPIDRKKGLSVPLTEEEQQLLLGKQKSHKLGNVINSIDDLPAGKNYTVENGTVSEKPEDSFWKERSRNSVLQKWSRMVQGAPVKVGPPPGQVVGKLEEVPAVMPGHSPDPSLVAKGHQALKDSPWVIPLAMATLAGTGGLGYMGIKNYLGSRRNRKLLKARDKAQQQFADSLLAERQSKLSSAIDSFVSACEEKLTIKQASNMNVFLNILGALALAGGGMGFYNGLRSEPGNLRKIKALRKARERQLALQHEFSPHIDSDFAFMQREGSVEMPWLDSVLKKEASEPQPVGLRDVLVDGLEGGLVGAGIGAGGMGTWHAGEVGLNRLNMSPAMRTITAQEKASLGQLPSNAALSQREYAGLFDAIENANSPGRKNPSIKAPAGYNGLFNTAHNADAVRYMQHALNTSDSATAGNIRSAFLAGDSQGVSNVIRNYFTNPNVSGTLTPQQVADITTSTGEVKNLLDRLNAKVPTEVQQKGTALRSSILQNTAQSREAARAATSAKWLGRLGRGGWRGAAAGAGLAAIPSGLSALSGMVTGNRKEGMAERTRSDGYIQEKYPMLHEVLVKSERDRVMKTGGYWAHFLRSLSPGQPIKTARLKSITSLLRATPITRHNAGQARESRNLASQYLTEKGIPHKINIGQSARTTEGTIPTGTGIAVPGPTNPYRVMLTSPSPGVAVHEAGHVANMDDIRKTLGQKWIQRLYAFRDVSNPIGTIAGGNAAVLGDADSALGRNAWLMPLLGAAPLLGEEAAASARGLNHLRKMRGRSAVIKELPILLKSLGWNAKLPAISSPITYGINRAKLWLQPRAEANE